LIKSHRLRVLAAFGPALLAAGAVASSASSAFAATAPTYDISTLAGKVASVHGTAGLQIRFSAFIEEQAEDTGATGPSSGAITPTYVLSSPLDGTSVKGPNVTVNQDTAAAPQNETAIAVDPNNPNRVLASANDYVTRTWTCTLPGAVPSPCSAHGDGYSGTYYSNDGGKTWCCASKLDGGSQGTLIPGVTHLSGGPYDAGGDPAVTFDSQGVAYYAGLGFNRASAPNTVTVNRGTFDASGALSWSAPTFINQTTSPAIFNDKEWIAADAHSASPFRDRVYVTFTRFIFNPKTGAYVQSPIMEAHSSDGGRTFSAPQIIGAPVLYSQGSRPVVGPDGTVYVFFDGATRFATLDSTYVVKSTDGGQTFSAPVQVSTLNEIRTPANTAFRVNSFPAADVAPNGDVYAAWSTEAADAHNGHASAVYSKSSDGGATWSTPALIFPALDAANRTPVGYDTLPAGTTLAPAVRRVDTFWPAVAISPSGRVYMSAYAADVVSPWQTCKTPATPSAVGRINCTELGGWINNARLDYAVADLTTGVSKIVTTHPINTRSQFGGGFIGDYTDLAVGSDNVYHALWTDTNNKQTVTWWYGYQFVPTVINQEDVVTNADTF
jgi:hypothetical protein